MLTRVLRRNLLFLLVLFVQEIYAYLVKPCHIFCCEVQIVSLTSVISYHGLLVLYEGI